MTRPNRRSSPRVLRHSLVLAAVLAAAAHAQADSSVSLYGLVDLSAGRSQAPGGAATQGVNSGNMSTSFIGFKGSEDLGGGLSAQFAIESFMRNDTGAAGRFNGDTFWARSANVGLSSGYGSVALGRNTTSLFVSVLVFNALGDSFGYSPAIRHYFTSGTVSGDTGWSDSVKYSSPKLGGASFSAHAAAGEADGGRNVGLSGLYFSGPFGATVAWQKVEKGAAVADTTTWNLGGSYDWGAAKLFAQYGDVDNKSSGNSYKIYGLGASVGAGATGKLLAQYGRVKPDTGATLRTVTVGYDHFLSKRTDAYVMLMNEARTGLSSGNSYGVGVRHRF